MPLMLSDLQIQWGQSIRDLRQERDWSLAKLARLTDIDQGQLSKIENGIGGVGDEGRFRIAVALRVQVGEIFTYPDTTTEPAEIRVGG